MAVKNEEFPSNLMFVNPLYTFTQENILSSTVGMGYFRTSITLSSVWLRSMQTRRLPPCFSLQSINFIPLFLPSFFLHLLDYKIKLREYWLPRITDKLIMIGSQTLQSTQLLNLFSEYPVFPRRVLQQMLLLPDCHKARRCR